MREYYCQRRKHKTKTVIRTKTLKQQKYSIALMQNSIKRALQILLNKLSKPKEKRTRNNTLPVYLQS